MTTRPSDQRTAVLQRFHAMQIPALSTEEERRLIALGKRGDARARDRLVRANIGLVMVLALRLKLGSVPIEDVIQEGIGGMVEAIERFDLSQPVRFGTYALWWAKARVGRYVKHARSVVRPRSGESAQQDVSLDNQVSEDGDATFGELLPDGAPLADEQHAAADHNHHVRRALWRVRARLGPLGWDIVERRLCAGVDAVTLEELGDEHGVSRERVRQVEIRVRELLGRYLAAAGFAPDEAQDPELAERIVTGRPIHRSAPPRTEQEPVGQTAGWRGPDAAEIAEHSDERLVERLRSGGWQVDAPVAERWLPPAKRARVSPEVIAANGDRALLVRLAVYEPPAHGAPANTEEDGMANLCTNCKKNPLRIDNKSGICSSCRQAPVKGRAAAGAKAPVQVVAIERTGVAAPAPKPLAAMTVDELVAARMAAQVKLDEVRGAVAARVEAIDAELRRRRDEIAKVLGPEPERASA